MILLSFTHEWTWYDSADVIIAMLHCTQYTPNGFRVTMAGYAKRGAVACYHRSTLTDVHNKLYANLTPNRKGFDNTPVQAFTMKSGEDLVLLNWILKIPPEWTNCDLPVVLKGNGCGCGTWLGGGIHLDYCKFAGQHCIGSVYE